MSAAEVATVALALWPAWVALAVAGIVARLESGRRLWPARRNPYAAPADVVEWRRRHYPQERP